MRLQAHTNSAPCTAAKKERSETNQSNEYKMRNNLIARLLLRRSIAVSKKTPLPCTYPFARRLTFFNTKEPELGREDRAILVREILSRGMGRSFVAICSNLLVVLIGMPCCSKGARALVRLQMRSAGDSLTDRLGLEAQQLENSG